MFKTLHKSFSLTIQWNSCHRNLTKASDTAHLTIKELQLKQYANSTDLSESLQLTSRSGDELQLTSKQIFIQLLASPINPADVNIIQGN